MRALTITETHIPSGALVTDNPVLYTFISCIFLALEAPHIFMGIREVYNYASQLKESGCAEVGTNDAFTKDVCGMLGYA